MIKLNKGKITIKGNLGEICAETSFLFMGIMTELLERKESVKSALEFMTSDVKRICDCKTIEELNELKMKLLEEKVEHATKFLLDMLREETEGEGM